MRLLARSLLWGVLMSVGLFAAAAFFWDSYDDVPATVPWFVAACGALGVVAAVSRTPAGEPAPFGLVEAGWLVATSLVLATFAFILGPRSPVEPLTFIGLSVLCAGGFWCGVVVVRLSRRLMPRTG